MLPDTPRRMATLPRTPSEARLPPDSEDSSDCTSSPDSCSTLWRSPGDRTTPARRTTNPSPLDRPDSARFVVCSRKVMEDDPFLEPPTESETVEGGSDEDRQDDSEEGSEEDSQAGSEEDSPGWHRAVCARTDAVRHPRGLPPGLLNFLQSTPHPPPPPSRRNPPPPPPPPATANDKLVHRLAAQLHTQDRTQTPPPRPCRCRRCWHQFYFRWEELETRDNARMALRTAEDYAVYGFRRRIAFEEAPRHRRNVSPTPSERGEGWEGDESGDDSGSGGEGGGGAGDG